MFHRVRRLTWDVGTWLDDRGGFSKALGPLLKHRVPPQLGGRAGWMYVLGASVLTVFIMQVVTGIALAMIYVPSPNAAHESLKFIDSQAPLGHFIRGMHFIGASFMVGLVAIHMARVVLTASYKFPRELNWLTGSALLMLTLFMAFTGQMLRWDQDAIGSVLVAADQMGRIPLIGGSLANFVFAGRNIGASTLTRFFVYHVFVFAGLIILIVTLHLYLVIHNGVSEPPRSGRKVDPKTYRSWYHSMLEREGLPYFPDAVWKEVAVAVVVIAAIMVLAWAVGPRPLGDPPDPTAVTGNPRPDWYMVWIYAILAKTPHVAEDWVIVGLPLAAVVTLIAVPFAFRGGERSPFRRPWAPAIVLSIALVVGGFWWIGRIAPWSPIFDAPPLTPELVGASSGPVWEGSQEFYARGCLYCHKVNGDGGVRGPDLTHVTKRLTDADIRARILTGPPGMPSYANILTPEQVDSILTFLKAQDARHPQ